jgi:integrase-like protein
MIEYLDADGERAYAKGFTDKGLTEQLAAKLENEVMLRKRGMTGLRRLELASLIPQSFKLDDAQPTLIVQAACSKHRRKATLPMHPELVAMVREWIKGLAPDEPLFPRLAYKKTYTMVQKDLERAGIPYETHEGLADFHAAGRHSHITGLVRSGASIIEAKELARHADIKQTARYVHIGMEDRAEALAGLPAPKTYQSVELSGICRVWGGALSQELSSDDSDDDPDDDPENDKTPCGKGVLSSGVTDFQELSVDVRRGGGGNCTRVPGSISGASASIGDDL